MSGVTPNADIDRRQLLNVCFVPEADRFGDPARPAYGFRGMRLSATVYIIPDFIWKSPDLSQAMPQLITSLAGRLTSSLSLTVPEFLRLLPLVGIHAATLIMMVEFESGSLRTTIYLLTWGFLNF